MVLTFVVNKLKHLLLFFVAIFRRALCCFRRPRRLSVDSVPLTHVGVVSNRDEENWSWEDKSAFSEPKTVQDHIDLYRKRKGETLKVEQPELAPEEEAFFEDMAPRITRQTKLFIDNGSKQDFGGNRLNLVETVPVGTDGAELREWEESSGWEGETLDWDAQEALREKKRKDRERRLWEQRQERGGRSLGARVST